MIHRGHVAGPRLRRLGMILLVGALVLSSPANLRWMDVEGASLAQMSARIERSTFDRPDDSNEYQIHVLYVIPSDGTDLELDLDGTIERFVDEAQQWFVGQTGGRALRFDTYKGALDITFFRLSESQSQIGANVERVRFKTEYELAQAGFDQTRKMYVVFYGGHINSPGLCDGQAISPPISLGNVALGATLPCERPDMVHFVMLHELVHNLGFVPPCAPNYTVRRHVRDDPRDLMYWGPERWTPSILDVGRNDYFEHTNPDCLDLAKSAFLEPPTPDAAPPPAWPSIPLERKDCSLEGSIRSPIEETAPTLMQFINVATRTLKLYGIDGEGRRVFIGNQVPTGFRGARETFVDHAWLVADPQENCLGIYVAIEQSGRVYMTDAR